MKVNPRHRHGPRCDLARILPIAIPSNNPDRPLTEYDIKKNEESEYEFQPTTRTSVDELHPIYLQTSGGNNQITLRNDFVERIKNSATPGMDEAARQKRRTSAYAKLAIIDQKFECRLNVNTVITSSALA